ncbi:MAG TPA: polysaccharide deacetylase family protein [Caulobacteraceae bacterium]|jgi:peptidoglycan/xylan/chitin deacetylase (PgdA/CDA1 family)|nr:polysaccharide deacetylase family protein [Caulobacteraceae bacterium]
MALDPTYLEYPRRRYGMDHDRYAWSLLKDRPKVEWPGGAKVALFIVPAIEVFPLDQKGQPFKLPGGMVTPYPDLRHFTLRDYGARVGVWRMLGLFDRLKLKATWAVNGRAAERYPYLLRTLAARAGDEIAAHGWDMDSPHYGGQPIEDETALVDRTLRALRDFTGQAVEGWVSPGRSESMATPDLLRAAGVSWFGDWANDDLPYPFHAAGGDLTAMPLSTDVDDRQILVEFRHSEAEFAQQLIDQFTYLAREAEATGGGRAMSLSLHPWVIGQPHRIGALEQALAHIAAQPGVWSATAGEIAAAWRARAGA